MNLLSAFRFSEKSLDVLSGYKDRCFLYVVEIEKGRRSKIGISRNIKDRISYYNKSIKGFTGKTGKFLFFLFEVENEDYLLENERKTKDLLNKHFANYCGKEWFIAPAEIVAECIVKQEYFRLEDSQMIKSKEKFKNFLDVIEKKEISKREIKSFLDRCCKNKDLAFSNRLNVLTVGRMLLYGHYKEEKRRGSGYSFEEYEGKKLITDLIERRNGVK